MIVEYLKNNFVEIQRRGGAYLATVLKDQIIRFSSINPVKNQSRGVMTLIILIHIVVNRIKEVLEESLRRQLLLRVI